MVKEFISSWITIWSTPVKLFSVQVTQESVIIVRPEEQAVRQTWRVRGIVRIEYVNVFTPPRERNALDIQFGVI